MSLIEQIKKVRILKTKVTFKVLNDENEIVPVEVTVYFKSVSTKDARDRQEKIKHKREAGETFFLADDLMLRITKIVEGDGTEIASLADFLDTMELDNLRKIESAMDNYLDPK